MTGAPFVGPPKGGAVANVNLLARASAPSWTVAVYPYWVMATLMIVAILSYMDRGALSLLIDPIKTALHLDELQVGLLIGPAFVVFYTTMGLVFGRWADFHSRRTLIIGGLVCWSLMTGLCGLAGSFGLLLVARMGVGVGEATLGPAAYSLIADYFSPHRRGVAMSIYSSGLTLGGGMAFIIGGLVVQWTHSLGPLTLPLVGRIASWQAPLLAMCVPGLVAAVLLFTVREPPRPQVAVGGDGPFKGRAVACYVMQNARPFGYITSGYALMVVVAVATVLWMPVFYMRVHGMAPGVFGLIYGGIYCLAGTGGLFAGGVISDWLAMRGKIEAPAYVVFWAILGSWPFYVGAFLVSSTTVSLLLVAIATFVLLLHGGLQGVTIQLIAPSRMRGRLAAAYLIIVNVVGMGLAPLLTAWFTEHVFGGPAGIGRSLALTVSLALPAGAALVRVGLPHVRELALSVNADGRAASIEGVGGRLVETEATL